MLHETLLGFWLARIRQKVFFWEIQHKNSKQKWSSSGKTFRKVGSSMTGVMSRCRHSFLFLYNYKFFGFLPKPGSMTSMVTFGGFTNLSLRFCYSLLSIKAEKNKTVLWNIYSHFFQVPLYRMTTSNGNYTTQNLMYAQTSTLTWLYYYCIDAVRH